MRFLPPLFLLLIVAAIYWPGLSGDFVFDDHPNIVGNASLRTFDGSLASLWAASGAGLASPLGRPLSMASFALNFHFWGDSPYSFKLVNLLIHLASGLLVFVLVRQVWPRLVGDAQVRGAALAVSALWLLHPINLTPVLFVVQRMTSLSALLTLAALVLYLHGRQSTQGNRWLPISAALLICWPAGVFAKETALLLPLFILLCEWLVLGSFSGLSRPARRAWLGMLVLACIAALGLLAANWSFVEHTYRVRDFTPIERFMTEARVLWLYVGQLLLPWPEQFSLHHDDISVSRGLLDPASTAWAIAGWAVVIAAAIWQQRRRPWLTFGLLWFLAGHSLESGILGFELAYEHRNYLPSLGIFIAVIAALLPAADGRFPIPRYALVGSIVAFCALVTGLRAAQWGDELIRTQIEANYRPHSARTHFEAGQAILARQLPTGEITMSAYYMARIHYQRAAQFDPRNKAALASVLYLDCAVREKQDEATRQMFFWRMAHERFSHGEERFIHGLSDLLVYDLLCLEPAQVEQLIATALANPTASRKIQGMLHAVAMDYAAARLHSMTKARLHAFAAADADPGNAVLRINLIRVLLQLGEMEEAKRQYATLRNLRISPANRQEVDNLGIALGR